MTYLGIDLGTSSVKVLLMDRDQEILASATSQLDVSRPHAGWSEQDPEQWVIETSRAIQTMAKTLKIAKRRDLSDVRGIGISGHMHGATLVDDQGEVLRPCMLWNDTRAHSQAAELDANPAFRRISGNIVFPGFTAPKLKWVQEEEPEVFAKVAKALLPKDYLRFALTGTCVSEMSDASGTSWLDVAERDWSEELLKASGMRRDQMPNLVEGSEVSGQLKPELARRWGMSEGVVVAGGAGDNAAAAIGMGTIQSGSAFVSLGTSGVLFASNDAYLPKPESAVHAFCHALPGTWHQMGVILSATDALNWLSNVTGKDPSDLDALLPETITAPSTILFLPYLSGERTPHNDASIRGVLTGLDHDAGPMELTKAVMQGVSFAIADSFEALRSAGTVIERVTAVGGGAKSDYWLELIATVLGLPVDVPARGDFGAAFGAARLGLLAAEGEDPLKICHAPKIARTIEPNKKLIAPYQKALSKYRALYPAIKNL